MTLEDAPASAPTLGTIGGYRLIRLLGEGAAGQVYLAEQRQPRREVAIKVLRSASALGRQRFEREVKLLAALEHTNIARLYDSGTEAGPAGELPYLVMEYVRGEDVLGYANRAGLDLRARLRLLATIARATHFAHTRGVIHRDLKPGNILVNERGEPKILDFGVAHVAADEQTQMTSAGEILGTIAYMSWEQLCGEAAALDARSDVYALGVIAYQLICGELPYPGLEKSTVVSALGRLQRDEPVRLCDRLPSARGDVDTIVMKALAREAGARYASAAELAADIGRYLNRQPIEARPPTLGYVIGLFARRHKAVSAAAAVVVVALIAATVISTRYALAEARARAAAEQRLSEREAVNRFLADMLTAADPEHALGEKISVLHVLDVARAELSARTDLPPSSVAQLKRALGNTYIGLGRYDAGLALLDDAVATTRGLPDADPALLARLELELADGLLASGQEDATARQLDAIPPSDDPRFGYELALTRANVLINQGHFEAAENLLEPLAARAAEALGPADPVTLTLDGTYAHVLQQQSKFDQALPIAVAARDAARETLGEKHPRVTTFEEVVANIKRDLGQFDEAIGMFEHIVGLRSEVFGAEHPQTLMAQAGLAATLAMAGRAADGMQPAAAAHEGMTRQLGADAEMTRSVASLYAYVASEAGDLATAARLNAALIAQAEAKPDGPSINDLVEYNNLGNNYRALGRLDDSTRTFARLVELAAGMLPPEHLHLALFRGNYAESLRRSGQFDAAVAQLKLSLPVVVDTFGEDHARVATFRQRLAWAEAHDATGHAR